MLKLIFYINDPKHVHARIFGNSLYSAVFNNEYYEIKTFHWRLCKIWTSVIHLDAFFSLTLIFALFPWTNVMQLSKQSLVRWRRFHGPDGKTHIKNGGSFKKYSKFTSTIHINPNSYSFRIIFIMIIVRTCIICFINWRKYEKVATNCDRLTNWCVYLSNLQINQLQSRQEQETRTPDKGNDIYAKRILHVNMNHYQQQTRTQKGAFLSIPIIFDETTVTKRECQKYMAAKRKKFSNI